MMRAFFRVAQAAAWIAVAAAPASAAEFNMDVSAAGISLGAHVSGVPAPESVANRVVLLEFWGVNCPPCIRSMPLLEELHTTLGPQGLVVIGAHAQGGTPDEIRAKVAELGVGFTIVDRATVEGGMDFQGIPHCMLFDHTGKCVYRGSPFDVQAAVATAVKAAPGALLEGRVLAKLPAFNAILRDERQFGTALKKARGMTANKDADTAAEATFVVERLEAHGRKMLEEAASAKESDPARAADLVQRCVTVYKGSELGSEAAALVREWKKDAPFQAAVRASQQLGQLELLRSQVLKHFKVDPAAGLAPEMLAALPPPVKGRILSLASGIQQAAPGSAAAAKAAAIAAEFAAPGGAP